MPLVYNYWRIALDASFSVDDRKPALINDFANDNELESHSITSRGPIGRAVFHKTA
jgi:hypothetical protein